MIIAMIPMWVVELSLIEIIDVIPMWNGLMSTFVMSTCTGSWGTTLRILAAHSNDMFIIVPFVRVVQMAVMEIVEMAVMLDRRMAAMLTMDVLMLCMNVMTHNPFSFIS